MIKVYDVERLAENGDLPEQCLAYPQGFASEACTNTVHIEPGQRSCAQGSLAGKAEGLLSYSP